MTDDVQIVSRGLYYTDMRVDPQDENRVYAISSRLFTSIDGGRSWERISRSTHVDFHSLWIDPLDPRRIWQGQDGGIAVSYDRGGTWDPIRNLPIAQFYQVFHDDREPFYYLGGGLQDNGTWYGPSRTREPAGILEDDWRMMSFGDAYWVVPHPDDPEALPLGVAGRWHRPDRHADPTADRRLAAAATQRRRPGRRARVSLQLERPDCRLAARSATPSTSRATLSSRLGISETRGRSSAPT